MLMEELEEKGALSEEEIFYNFLGPKNIEF